MAYTLSYKLSYEHERNLIVGEVQGELDPALVEQMAHEFADLVISTGCRRLLNDLRKARITRDAFHIYAMPGIVKKRRVPVGCRRALLISESSEEYRFLETVSKNACQQVRIFHEMQAALDWLGVGEASRERQEDGESK